MKKYVNCPTCQKPVIWSTSNTYRPFCNKRCRLIDLGQWADEKYHIPTNEQPSMESDGNESS